MQFTASIVVLILVAFLSTACAPPKSGAPSIPVFPPTMNGPAELDYCTTSVTYSGTTSTITGKGQYQYRTHFGSGSSGGLGYVEGTARPIRRAEVRVLDSAGNVAQCAETDANGDFSFSLPQNSNSYTIQINSRANNSFLKATVFNQPELKEFYSLTTTVVPDATKSVGSVVASATSSSTLLGGAFNILDQLLNANDYLRTQVGTCSFSGCPNFTVAPKVEVFWRKGFNPGSYYDTGGLSFYLPGYSRMFILGGINGDTDNSDTDHFDNSVIIHEYGHFLEDQVFKSDSPGGSHNGNKIIDPRLAWSEGWGNFLQAAVQDSGFYIDTIGNRDGSTTFGFYVGLETGVSGKDLPQAGAGGALGEGNFREFSVSRLLWDAIDTNDDGETISGGFPEIWSPLVQSNGWTKATNAFRSIGLFHLLQTALTGGTDWSTLVTNEKQVANRSEYAEYVDTTGCTGNNFNIIPQSVSGDAGTFSTSDLFRNNNFYHLYVPTARSNVTLRLEYLDADASGTVADLDLYLYNSTARFGHTSDWVGYSRLEPSGSAASSQVETINIASLPAGHYLINVFVFTGKGVGGETNYKIQYGHSSQSLANLCATNLP